MDDKQTQLRALQYKCRPTIWVTDPISKRVHGHSLRILFWPGLTVFSEIEAALERGLWEAVLK